MATESSRSSSSSADSYIGSLISLTSKSEIRYEGILYNINTEESSIGLRNVRSFGTEGRKKDGPQLMPSDKVYEYILFRGSDIKDLQVKSSLPAQPPQPQPIHNDPAIIQSHYPRPPPTSSTLPAVPSTHNPQPTLQGGPPLGSWAPMPPPPNPNTTGLPMYWPGFYAPPNGLPPPPALSMYPSYNGSLPGGASINMPEYPSSLLAASTSSVSTNDTLPSVMQNKPPPPNSVGPTPPLSLSNGYPIMPFPISSVTTELSIPSLVTPGQIIQSGQSQSQTTIVSSQFTQTVHKDAEVVQVAPIPTQLSESSAPVPVPVSTEAQPPILPLLPQARITPMMNGGSYQNRQSYNYRGRERGRGYGGSRSVMNFTEEFDFNAMNEKFNKDEIWGSLGKSSKNDGNDASYEDEFEDENDNSVDLPKVDVKPVYSKDDFFDTLSCNSLNNQSNNNGRTRFSEQMKLDTETFGEFSRYRGGGRGGRGGYRGGRSRGYYGRGGGGGGYNGGYGGRGRGGRTQNPAGTY